MAIPKNSPRDRAHIRYRRQQITYLYVYLYKTTTNFWPLYIPGQVKWGSTRCIDKITHWLSHHCQSGKLLL